MSIVYSKDIVDIPKHLDVEFFEEVAEQALRLSLVKVGKVEISMGSNTGENYCSLIYRVHISYTLSNCNELGDLWVICKCIPRTQATEFLEDLAVFKKEEVFYNQLLPRMEILLPAADLLGGRLLYSRKKPVKTLVFEDLSRRNFKMASRETGLDEAHCRLVMKTLGQFHATSLIVAQKDVDILKTFDCGMLSKTALEKENSMLVKYFESNACGCIDKVSEWPGYEDITKKLQTFATNLKEHAWRSQAPMAGEFRVMNHGDLWVNNMLFKYNSHNNPEQVLFLDLQLSVWGSPGIDLNYFFYTSLAFDLLKHKRDQLLKIYYESLSSTLIYLHYTDIPSYEQILHEVRQRENFGFFANYAIFPTIAMDKQYSSDNSLENFQNEEFAKNKVKQMYSSERVQETLRYTLKRFEQMGIFN